MRRHMAIKNLLSLLNRAPDVARGTGSIRGGMRDGKIDARMWAGLDLFLCRRR